MKDVFYAVRKGLKDGPAIFTSWEECAKNVLGVPGVEFRKFTKMSDAKAYLDREDEAVNETGDNIAYIDGSFNEKTGTYGYGGFLVAQGKKYPFKGSGRSDDGIAGEINGACAAITKASWLGLKSLTIYHDLEGLEKWADGAWKTNDPITKAYKDFVTAMRSEMDITFRHVKGHSGNPGNAEADRIARIAVGIE